MVRLKEVILVTRNLLKQKEFFQHALELPVITEDNARFTVRAGKSLLTFTDQSANNSNLVENPEGRYHYAFNIPENQFYEGRDWLSRRTEVLGSANDKNQTQFHFDSWDADACYFKDADGNIGELIARHQFKETRSNKPFTSSSLLHISEIMLPSQDVIEVAKQLRQALGIQNYSSSSFDFDTSETSTFQFLGNEEGLLILCEDGRYMLPDFKTAGTIKSVKVRLNTNNHNTQNNNDFKAIISTLPYEFKIE